MHLRLTVLAALAVVQAVSASAQPVRVDPDRPTIVVDGRGEIETAPDLATFSYELRGEGTTSDGAVRAMVATGARIERAIRSLDAAAVPLTSKVQVEPARGANCKDADYDSAVQLSTGPCAIVGYVATQTVTIRTAKVQDAGTMVGLAGREGARSARINAFELGNPRPAKAQAIAAALADAQAKASAIAAASRLTVGPILNVSTGERSVAVLTSQEVRIEGLAQSYAAAPPPVVVNLRPEPITSTATVTVTYAIAR